MTPKKDLELYLHIPFCRQKCRYCDFLSAPLAVGTPGDADVRGMDARREIIRNAGSGQQSASATDAHVPESYVDALITQIVQESQFYQERRVTTIFWGGGTPSLLRVMDMERLMDVIRAHFCVADDAEITLESNPGTLDFEKLVGYRRAGINRLSMGLQSACDKELAMLGRIHNFDTFVQNYKQARRAGFENINVDLMSALPGQTVESWEQTLMKAAELAPEHLSAYSLISKKVRHSGAGMVRMQTRRCARKKCCRFRRKRTNAGCMPERGKFWNSMATIGMKFRIMRRTGMPAATTSATGTGRIIWGSGLERRL